MVRINIIPVYLLTDQHLNAEHTEILMLLAYIKKTKNKPKDAPEKYTLNKGHMKFFWDKVGYLVKRFYKVCDELDKRGYNIEQWQPLTPEEFVSFKDEQFVKYEPTREDYKVITERIISKIRIKPSWYKYYGQTLTMKDYERIYSQILEG